MNEKIQAFLKGNGFAPTREDRMEVMRAFEGETAAAMAGAPETHPISAGIPAMKMANPRK